MVSNRAGRAVQHLQQVAALSDAQLSDGQLLAAFLAERDEAAFAALVRRYGSMVLGICRRVLRNTSDAEDAFQAAFLVLVRRAAEVHDRATLGNWLYGVAYRTALQARTANARRRRIEGQARSPDQDISPEDAAMRAELQKLLDQELSALPDKYREVIVLCELLGTTKRDAALQLGRPEGTVSSRLARGRELLRERLKRRGTALSLAALAALLERNKAPAAAPLIDTTVKTAALLAAGNLAAASALTPKAAALMEGVVKSMLLTRLKIVTVVMVLLTVLGATTTLIACRSLAGPEPTKTAPERGAEAKVAQVEEAKAAVPNKERYLYEEKKFAYWRDLWRYDLSPSVRIKALKALAAFGANGYADEVTAAILDVMRDYDPARDDREKIVVESQVVQPQLQPQGLGGFQPGGFQFGGFQAGGFQLGGGGNATISPVYRSTYSWMGTKVVQTAQETLVQIGSDALPSLTKGWENGTLKQRRFVAEALVRMVDQARPTDPSFPFQGSPNAEPSDPPQDYPPEVVSLLIRLLKDKDAVVRRHAISGLGLSVVFAPKKDEKPAVPNRKEIGDALASVLKDDNEAMIRADAAKVFFWLNYNEADRLGVSALKRAATDDPNRSVRLEALRSLSTDPKDPRLIPLMLKVLDDETERETRAKALFGTMFGAPGLMVRQQSNESLADVCAGFFNAMNTDQTETITALIAALQTSRTVRGRVTVIGALEQMGPKAKAAAPVLHERLNGDNAESDPFVRAALAKALKVIRPNP